MESDRIVPVPFSHSEPCEPLPEYSRSYEDDCAAPPRSFSYAEAAAASSSLLDPQETSLHVVGFGTEEDTADINADISFRHSYWQHRRVRVFRALESLTADPMRLHRFRHCGQGAWVQRAIGKPGVFRVISAKCHDRFCEACQREKRLRICANLVKRLPDGRVRFVTLTLKSSRDPLGDQVDRLIGSFAKLRRGRKMKGCFAGGCWFLEVTRNKQTGLWHPHLHVMCQGDFIPVDLLRREWLRCTGDSFIVDVREIKHVQEVAGYVTKYAAKAVNVAAIDNDEDLREVMRCFQSRRMYNPFGSWKGLKLSDPPDTETEWEYFATLAEIRRKAKAGDDVSLQILHAVRQAYAVAMSPTDYAPPPF